MVFVYGPRRVNRGVVWIKKSPDGCDPAGLFMLKDNIMYTSSYTPASRLQQHAQQQPIVGLFSVDSGLDVASIFLCFGPVASQYCLH
jgi:hypothetical protein